MSLNLSWFNYLEQVQRTTPSFCLSAYPIENSRFIKKIYGLKKSVLIYKLLLNDCFKNVLPLYFVSRVQGEKTQQGWNPLLIPDMIMQLQMLRLF